MLVRNPSLDVIYLDYNASVPLREELLADLTSTARRSLGNASSIHQLGRLSRRLINDATEALAGHFGCATESVYWTSGASEANSWVLHSVASAASSSRPARVILSAIEHDSTLVSAQSVRSIEAVSLRVLPTGVIDLNHLDELLSSTLPWDLVSVLHVNNETGVIQPLSAVAERCMRAGVPLHIDCAQSVGKVAVNLMNMPATYATFSAHKIGGPKGVGALIAQGSLAPLEPLVHGKHQRGLRGGTENSLGVALTGQALRLIERSPTFPERLERWHRDFENELKRLIPGTIVHGENANRVLNTSFIGFIGVENDSVLLNLDLEGICASSGSACSAGTLQPSHVLTAMGCDTQMARSSVRFSSGYKSDWSDFERTLSVLPSIIERVRSSSKRSRNGNFNI